jgi:hypothetical protein
MTKEGPPQVSGHRSYVVASLACVAVAVSLAPVALAGVTDWPFPLPRAVDQAGFAVALSMYLAWWVCTWRASSGAYAIGAVWPLGLAPASLLIEGGAAGFVGFSSNWRYVPLALAVWGGIRFLRTLLSLLYLRLLGKRG